MDNLTETKLTSEKIYSGCILDFYRDTVRLPNGGTAPRELSRHVGAVCIVPLLDDGRVIVERQFRYPVNEVITEIPAGKRNSRDEAPEAAARRELREETGLRLTAITHVLPPAACTVGVGDERTVCVFGTAEGTFRPSRPHGGDRVGVVYARAGARPARDGPLRFLGAGL